MLYNIIIVTMHEILYSQDAVSWKSDQWNGNRVWDVFHSNKHIPVSSFVHHCRVLLQASPLYIAEIAPKEKRGIMIALVNGFSTTGSVVSLEAVQVHVCVSYSALQDSCPLNRQWLSSV